MRLRQFLKQAGLTVLLFPALSYAASLSQPVARQVQKAIELQSNQHLHEAVALLSTLHTPTPYDRAFVQKVLGAFYWEQGNELEAINVLTAAVNSAVLIGDEDIETRRMLADILLSQARNKDALKHYYHLVENGQTSGKNADIWLRIAQAHYVEKQFEPALTAVNRHLLQAAANVSVLTIKLGAELSLEKWKQATETLTLLIEKEPANKTWWIQLVANYQKLGLPEKMLSTLVLAERSGVSLTESESQLMAQLHTKLGAPEKGATVLSTLNRKTPNETRLAAEASYWQLAKAWDRAIDVWAKAAEFNPKYYWVAAQLALQNRQYQRGLLLLEHVTDSTSPARLALAKAHALDKLGRISEALEQAKAAHTLSPTEETESWLNYLSQKNKKAAPSNR